jgi:hypothetical protein
MVDVGSNILPLAVVVNKKTTAQEKKLNETKSNG